MGKKQLKRFSVTLDSWVVNLSKTGRSRKQAVSIAVDSVLVIASLWMAYSLRHGMIFSDFRSTWYLFLGMPIATVIIFMSLGIYRWIIRSSNKNLFRQLTKASIVSAFLLVLFTFIIPPDRTTPRSLFIIYGLLLTFGAVGVRYVWQSMFDSGRKGEPVAIYGAGDAGRQLFNSLSQGHQYQPVLFLDDNPVLQGTTVSGLNVLGNTSDLANILRQFEVERVILAIPSLSAAECHTKIDSFKDIEIPFLTIPTHAELVSGIATYDQVRDVSIADILGRAEVPPDAQRLGLCVKNKTVLVTGGGGSIGSELCRQIITQNPIKLIILDHSEENLYKISEELEKLTDKLGFDQHAFVPTLCSITDSNSLEKVFKKYRIDTVYHAAAYKHVPIIEQHPEQGVKVNIFGTQRVLQFAIANEVKDFVLISTDKAVRPTSAMGATKRIGELILQATASKQPKTRISMVRFGNVLGSSGSVVPKFMKQIENGGPITLTDENITRYFMTIPEAAQLVLQSSSIAKGGDVFVLDMGQPIKIIDLAESMVHLLGKKLKRDTGKGGDIEIVIEGLREGEKMYEELFVTGVHSSTEIKKVFAAKEDFIEPARLDIVLNELKVLIEHSSKDVISNSLLKIAHLDVEDLYVRKQVGVNNPVELLQRSDDLKDRDISDFENKNVALVD